MKTHSSTSAAPDETASYAQDGLTAEFYRGRQDAVSDQAVIILGGSDGNFKTTQQFAAAFADHGLNTLALPYYGQPHLPKDLAQIPVETVETAAGWLHRRGFTRIGIWGISMGAQLALLAASLIPAIGRVAAVSPLDVCVQGLQVSPRKRLLAVLPVADEQAAGLARQPEKPRPEYAFLLSQRGDGGGGSPHQDRKHQRRHPAADRGIRPDVARPSVRPAHDAAFAAQTFRPSLQRAELPSCRPFPVPRPAAYQETVCRNPSRLCEGTRAQQSGCV